MAQLARIEWADGATNRFYVDSLEQLAELMDELTLDYPGVIVNVQWPHEEDE